MEREAFTQPEWEETHEDFRLSPVLRSGHRLYLSGHTGEPGDDSETQIRGAFEDTTRSLRLAGASWNDVVSITSYHVALQRDRDLIVRIHNEFVIRKPYPTWTGVGVTELVNGSIIEVAVIAELPGDRDSEGDGAPVAR